ncbi:hypothetical protein QJQ45_020141 [Haematococcus lacustris]|nr:hypothetical protein QJQ45_020141 [Haematococcus lacustris]
MAALHCLDRALCARGCTTRRLPTRSPVRTVLVRSTGWADPAATNAEKTLFGDDFGARDPTAGELASNFSEKVLGNYDTAHIIKWVCLGCVPYLGHRMQWDLKDACVLGIVHRIPTSMKEHIGLTAQSCQPLDSLAPLDSKQLNLLKQQIPGWKVVTSAVGHTALSNAYRVRSREAASALHAALTALASRLGHELSSISASDDLVAVELSTPQLSGLSLNDFVVAAQVNEMDMKEWLTPPRKRYWA